MTEMSETMRVEKNVDSEVAPRVEIRLLLRGAADSDDSLVRAREVMRVVAGQRERGPWPEDAWWKSSLPDWFLDPFEGRSIDEVMKNPELWDFGSWLDAMKSPGWEWWSSGKTDDGWIIRVRALSDPYSIGPLEYLARASGAGSVEIQEG